MSESIAGTVESPPPTPPRGGGSSFDWLVALYDSGFSGRKGVLSERRLQGSNSLPIWESLRQIAKQIEAPACLFWPENAHKHTYTHKRTQAHLHTRLRCSDQRPIPDSGACRQSLSYHPPEHPAQSQYSFSGPSLNWSLWCSVWTVCLSSMTNRTWQPY